MRIRESIYYLDPDSALSHVCEHLDRHGILPGCIEAPPQPATPFADGECCYASETNAKFVAGLPHIENKEEDGNQDTSLEEYIEWEPHKLPDPRRTSFKSVIDALVEIVETEGPATWRRVIDCYRIGLGLGRLKGPTRKALEHAGRLAEKDGRVIVWSETGSGDWYDYVVHTPDSPCVRVRQRGPRELNDVPCSEIAELMRMKGLEDDDEERQFRQVLACYGLRRLTDNAKAHLRRAAAMLGNFATTQ